MKPIIFYFFLLVSLFSPTFGFGQWTNLAEPFGCSVRQFDTDGDYLYVLTNGGVFKSQDLGENWDLEPASRPYETDARQLQVENGNIYLYLVDGSIVRKENNATTFEVIFAKPYLLSAPGERVFKFFAIGDTLLVVTNLTIYRSTDRGNNWIKTVSYYEDNCLSFGRIGQNYFIATDFRIWKSTDAGLNWVQIFQNAHGIAAFSVFDSTLYLLYETNIRFSKSVNLGANWIHQDINTIPDWGYPADFEDYILKMGDTLVHVTDQGCVHGQLHIRFSTDDGKIWQPTPIKFLDVYFTKNVVNIGSTLFIGSGKGVLKFDSLVASFKVLEQNINAKPIYNIEEFKDKMWVSSYQGLYSSDKNGQNWQSYLPDLFKDGCKYSPKLSKTNNRLYLASLDYCTLNYTEDGQNWKNVKIGNNTWDCSTYAVSDAAAWGVDEYKLYKMTDADTSFSIVNTPTLTPNYGVYLYANNGMLILRNYRNTYFSIDNAQTWDSIPAPLFENNFPKFGQFEHFDENHLFVKFYNSKPTYFDFYRFDFADKTWRQVFFNNAETSDSLNIGYKINILSEKNGIYWMNYNGKGLYFSDVLSEIWHRYEPHPMSRFVSAIYYDENTFWIGTDNHGIYVGDVPNFEPKNGETLDFALYPNPSSGKLTIESNFFLDSDAQLEVFSITGQRLLWGNLTWGNKWEKDFSQFPSGIYLLRLQSNFGEKTVKWVKN
jgi:hypothetical protein